MDIILLERIEKLGSIGDVVSVKDGYARNFLLPNKKALRANDSNKKVFEANRSKIESDNASRRGEAETHSKDVEGKQVILIRASSNSGQLYGSVSVRDIVDALNADGAKLGSRWSCSNARSSRSGCTTCGFRCTPKSRSWSRSTSRVRPMRPHCRRRASM